MADKDGGKPYPIRFVEFIVSNMDVFCAVAEILVGQLFNKKNICRGDVLNSFGSGPKRCQKRFVEGIKF
ncbi:MAG: hypothetical protein IPO92_06885 [Saprospiraceae bacterium]|nr:hypothetical protein [Saprospiraceae bacterium]